MRGRYLAFAAAGMLLLLGLGFAGCTRAPDPWKDAKAGQKHILVTFPPLYSFTHAIAGDDAFVLCYLAADGPHDYQFSPIDAIKAKDSHLLIFNGLELDNRFVRKINERRAVPTLEVGAQLPESMLMPMGKEDDDGDKHDDKDGHHHHHGVHDPHIWLGPPQAMAIADAIGKKLAEIDATHADGYTKRTAQLKDQLAKLHAEGKDRFKDKKNRKVLTMHDSFGYFAKAFGLEVAGSIQEQPNVAPDAARFAKLEDMCRKQLVGVITFEPQFTDAQPRKLAKHLKERGLAVEIAEFDPLETAPLDAGGVNPAPAYYFDKMKANIDNLAKALP
jgi:ABC-type Zn uptake system ZnuABC Zn-binding protein ZnuA